MSRIAVASGIGTILAIVSAPARGADVVVYDSTSAQQLVNLMREFGYAGEPQTTAAGRPWIRGQLGANGFWVNLHECDEAWQHCKSVQFAAGFAVKDKPAPQAIDEWNATYRWAHASVDADGDPFLRMDAGVHGVTDDYFTKMFTTWNRMLTMFLRAFVLRPSGPTPPGGSGLVMTTGR